MKHSRPVQNAKWIIVCRLVQSLLQMVIGMLSARYLGPSHYGLISYAASVTAFAVPIMRLGMDATLVQEYVEHPDKEGEVLGSSLLMSFVSSLACMAAVVCFARTANPGEPVTILVCTLYSTSLAAQAMETIQYWYQARLLSKYSSLITLIAYVAVSVYKLYLLLAGKGVCWFALSHFVEYGVAGLLLLWTYRRLGSQKLSFSLQRARDMFSRSRHYILASLMVMMFQTTDRVMLTLVSGSEETGFYTAAVTCTVIVSFVYTAIMDSARPLILEAHRQSRERFEQGLSLLYSGIIYLTFAQSISFSLLAKPIVALLYGGRYDPAVKVLRILVWQLAFSYMGAIRNIWLLAEEKHSLLWLINLWGAAANVLLNLLMIPCWGACGAAFASVLTQIFTNFVLGFLLKPIRPNNRLLLKGLDPGCFKEVCRMLRR